MKIQPLSDFDAIRISEITSLDPVMVIMRDTSPGAGYFVVECYGRCWSCFWGSMGANTVRSFVVKADTDYVVNKLVNHQLPSKMLKSETEYLNRIITVVQKALGA